MELTEEFYRDARHARYLERAKEANREADRHYGHVRLAETWRMIAASLREIGRLRS
jgi:hypothetical protein